MQAEHDADKREALTKAQSDHDADKEAALARAQQEQERLTE